MAKYNRSDVSNIDLNLELDEAECDESEAVDIVLPTGAISLHDVFLYHGSEASRSYYPRCGMTLRYLRASSAYCHTIKTWFERTGPLDMSDRTIYLIRATDQSGQNDFRVR